MSGFLTSIIGKCKKILQSPAQPSIGVDKDGKVNYVGASYTVGEKGKICQRDMDKKVKDMLARIGRNKNA